MSYATIEAKVYDLLAANLDDDVIVRRGYHQPDALKSVAVRPGSATRNMSGQGTMGNHWQVQIEIRVSTG